MCVYMYTYILYVYSIFFLCDYFQSGGEVYCRRTWLSHSRRGQRGPVFLHPAELHWARYRKKNPPSFLIATSSTSLCYTRIETSAYRKMVQRLIQGVKLSEKKHMLTKKAHTLNHVHPHLKDTALFSSVSKAKASAAAPAAIRTSCANTWKMKLKKITETSKVNDPFFSLTLRPLKLFPVSLKT